MATRIEDEAGFHGLPPNLLQEDEQGSPRVFSLMPGLNRSERRGLATRIRGGLRDRNSRRRSSDAEVTLDAWKHPTFRRMSFWHEMRGGPPSSRDFRPSTFIAVDYWLLREIDSNLDLLAPLSDERMSQYCPHWERLVRSLDEVCARYKTKADTRYFALWPRILDAAVDWTIVAPNDRYGLVNATFALSSISGDPWFVEELKRRCPESTSYFDGLKYVGETDEGPSDEAEDVSGPDLPGPVLEAGDPVPETDAWRAFGAELRAIRRLPARRRPDERGCRRDGCGHPR